jgi:signal transduction histidine kinase
MDIVAMLGTTKQPGKDGRPRPQIPPLRFRPAARLQYLLSEQLVSDPNVAVLEFVKNGYDADATDILVEFDLAPDVGESSIFIADNGVGMDHEDFVRNWMSPGYSEKLNARVTSKSRIPVGEKGLGRLAAGRLGATLDVYSRTASNQPWFHAFFRWEDFNNQEKLLDEIEIDWDLESKPPVEGLGSGTVIYIRELSLRWDRRPPGRRAKGQAVTRLGRLRQDLEVLLLPLTAGGQDFALRLQHNSELPEDAPGYGDDEGAVSPPTLKLLDYEYRFEVKQTAKGKWQIARTVLRSPAVAALTGAGRKTTTTVATADLTDDENLDFDASGPFSGSFFYAPESAKAFKQLRIPTGVRIYRDSVRVDPYGGPGDDWLGSSERKAVRQGHAAIAPNQLYGAVKVGRKTNPDLKPLADREGFIGNAAFDAFIAICREEFEVFGKYIERELLRPRWDEQQAKKRSEEAFNSRQWAVAMTRATAHVVRQPVTSAGAELRTLRKVIDDAPSLPKGVRAELEDLADRTKQHLNRIDAAIEKMLGFLDVDPEPKEVDLVSLVEEVVQSVAPDATSASITLDTDLGQDAITVTAPGGLVEHALQELLENAIQAPRPNDRPGWVRVRVAQKEGVRIQVSDNASGLDDKIRSKLFTQTVSRTGRIGVGLMFNRQLMTIARGDIQLEKTGPDGSRFSVVLPQ